MGQAANSNRRASLDDKKERSAGRQRTPGYHELNRDDFGAPEGGRGQVKGAFGSSGKGLTQKRPSNLSKGGGGGGAAQSTSKERTVGPSSRPARKRKG